MRVLAVLLLVPLASAATLDDPAGDVRVEAYGVELGSMPDGFDGLDLLSLEFQEEVDELVIIVGVEGLPACNGGVCADSADLRTHFRYGETMYFVQMGLTLDGFAVARLQEEFEDGSSRLITQDLISEASSEDNTFTLYLPRELITDESGTPLLAGRTIDDIWTNSYGQFNLAGPSPDLQSTQDAFVTRDDMGIDDPTNLTLRYGGVRGEGPIELTADAPFRASNGGAATYAYSLTANNVGDDAVFRLDFLDAPTDWVIQAPNGTMALEAGEERAFTVAITTPPGHRHGGAEQVEARIERVDDDGVWSSVDLGVRYLDVPQPAGHHPYLRFHSRDIGAMGALSAAAGGTNGEMWMNTLEDDADDQQATVAGISDGSGVIWSMCMRPQLRIGIDLNESMDGGLDMSLAAERPYQGVTVSGRLLHLGPGDDIVGCYPQRYAEREQTELIAFEATDIGDMQYGDTADIEIPATVLEASKIPYEPGATLVLEVRADYVTGAEGGAGGMFLQPGGAIRLPIDEYRDDRPPGFIEGSAVYAGNVTDFEEPVAAKKESPAGWLVLPLAVAILLRRR